MGSNPRAGHGAVTPTQRFGRSCCGIPPSPSSTLRRGSCRSASMSPSKRLGRRSLEKIRSPFSRAFSFLQRTDDLQLGGEPVVELSVLRMSFLLPVRIRAVLNFFVGRAIRGEEIAHLSGRPEAALLAQGRAGTRNTGIVFHLLPFAEMQ